MEKNKHWTFVGKNGLVFYQSCYRNQQEITISSMETSPSFRYLNVYLEIWYI